MLRKKSERDIYSTDTPSTGIPPHDLFYSMRPLHPERKGLHNVNYATPGVIYMG